MANVCDNNTHPVLVCPALSHISKIRAQFASSDLSGVAFSTEDTKTSDRYTTMSKQG